VGWLVERISELWPGSVRWSVDEEPHPHEARYLKLDSSRARTRLGWRPAVPLDNAIASVVEWYRELAADGDMRNVSLGQIEALQHTGV
jgi:CDP-glucose 4,6-dehydratase